MTDMPDRHRRLVHGRRKGHRLRSKQAKLVAELLPRLCFCIDGPEPADTTAQFAHRPDALWLEVGFGAGEHLFAQAQSNPRVGLIGCEPFINGMAQLLSQIDNSAVENIRIHNGDARDLMDAMPDGCVERVFILFPDPWPKTRHHKRRFICTDNLDQLARIMSPGAELRFASDIPDYVRWTLDHMRRHPAFEWQAHSPRDWRIRPEDWPATRYERKALDAGRIPSYLCFRRVL